MGISRNILLWGSKNPWLLKHVPNYTFVRRALKRFMPGENLSDAIEAAKVFNQKGISTVFTHLGENITQMSEAEKVKSHYIDLLHKIKEESILAEVSLKLTQIGLDLSFDQSLEHFNEIASAAENSGNFVWIDMEGSSYTDVTIDFYRRTKMNNQNTGVCLQAYLRRTEKDLKELIDIKPNIRLVKGAYSEVAEIAFPDKRDVDGNYMKIAGILLDQIKKNNITAVFGTHDLKIIEEIERLAAELNVPHDKLEFHMLYGIKPNEQLRLVSKGYKLKVLISYGEAWYPWYMRRLAERPANVGFVLKNLFAR